MPHSRPCQSRRNAFTLIEILVVVAIIVVLAAIIIAVGSSVRQTAQIRQTRALLKVLDGILKEKVAEGALPGNVADMGSFIATVKVYPRWEKMLSDLPGKAYVPGTNSVKDAFGNDILFVRKAPDGASYFQSVGPNGQAGDADDILSNEPTR